MNTDDTVPGMPERIRISALASKWARTEPNLDQTFKQMSKGMRFSVKQEIQRRVSITPDVVEQFFLGGFIGGRPLPEWRRLAIRSVLSEAELEMAGWRERTRRAAYVPRDETIAAIIEITTRT